MGYPTIYPTGATVYNPDKCWNGYTVFHFFLSNFPVVTASQKGDTRRGAFSSVVELSKTQSIGGKFIDIWRIDFPTVTSKIRKAHIIH